MTKRLSSITRKTLIDVIEKGFVINELDEDDVIDSNFYDFYGNGKLEIHMPFYGRLNEFEFLSRLYPLAEMPSTDSRFESAEGDIWQHTVNNSDWGDYWFFEDFRFQLMDGSDDEPILKFICEMIHPAVVAYRSPWRYYFEKFNEILSHDGYVIYSFTGILGWDEFTYKTMNAVEIKNHDSISHYDLTPIGSGSYANVFCFTDSFYDMKFALKRAKKNLSNRELERFKREFDEMKSFNSSHILSVYRYDVEKNQYIMEYMDMTLQDYIDKNNDILSIDQRKSIIDQLIDGYKYLHSEGRFHRDVSPRNALVKILDDGVLVKISDFGLVKIPESNLTSENTEFKGSLNDPELKFQGFSNYNLSHEIYALTQLIGYIITGKTNFDKISSPIVRSFIKKGTNPDKTQRFQSLDELKEAAIKCLYP